MQALLSREHLCKKRSRAFCSQALLCSPGFCLFYFGRKMRAHNWAFSRGRRFSPLLPCLYCRPWPALDVTSQTVVIARPFKRGDPAYETRLGKRGFWVESLRAGKVGGPISRCVHVGVAAGVGVGGLYVCSCSGAGFVFEQMSAYRLRVF